MSGTPLLSTQWYHPAQFSLVNVTTHLIKNGHFIKIPEKPIMNVFDTQPDISYLKNCTAAITQPSLLNYPWIVIPCEELHEATYVCQDNKIPKDLSIAVYNHTCDDGWFTVTGSDKCFSMTRTDKELSFSETQAKCSAQNSSILSVDVMTRPDEGYELSASYRRSIISGSLSRLRNVPKSLHLLSERELPNILAGQLLSNESMHSVIPHMTIPPSSQSLKAFEEFENSKVFAEQNNTCSVVDRSMISFAFNTGTFKNTFTKSWGVKCRACDKPIRIATIVCEKPPKPYIIQCEEKHFTCDDTTCILRLYICDMVRDCFDGSDENNCQFHLNKSPHQFLVLPGISNSDHFNIILIHSICDGIYFNEIFTQEKDLCAQFKLNRIHLVSKTHNNPYNKIDNVVNSAGKIYDLYIKESQSCSDGINNIMKADNSYSQLPDAKVHSTVNYNNIQQCSTIMDFCILGVYKHRCPMFSNIHQCAPLSCPGLFKCAKDYCIYMSSVCDGQYDCRNGDDEILCPLTSCPGLLKCRGEHRCVSTNEICDNHINCLYSMDDEMGCYECHVNCTCSGYSVFCNLDNSLDNMSLSGMNYIKGLLIKGIQQIVIVDHLNFSGLIYLNSSDCGIKQILTLNMVTGKQHAYSFILIVDMQNNYLTEIHYLRSDIFSKMIYLDLSFNELSTIKYITTEFFKNLLILSLRGNPLKEITLNTAGKTVKLSLIDLRSIYRYSSLRIVCSAALHKQLLVKVSDLLMCCILQQNIKCTSNSETKRCFGLFSSRLSQVMFYVISLFAFLLSLLVMTKHSLIMLSKNGTRGKKKYYLIAVMNHSLSTVLNC